MSSKNANTYSVNAVRKWHVEYNGWSQIGYHVIIDHDGKTVFGRDINRRGAHTKEDNDTIGICVLGRHIFSEDQFKALATLCRFFMLQHGIDAGNIYPHNYYNKNKTCPNFDVEQWKIDYLEPELCRWN
jgi:predicted glycosyltransferase involved in capsule biosynthesis